MARVCHDERDGLIAILRDFANNGTAYIVPWRSLPLVTAMTEQDKALHQAVGEARACTPADVRVVVSRLALSGALGPEAKARERDSAHTEQARRADMELILILHLLESCGADLRSFAADPARWPAHEAKSAVKAAAKAMGLKQRDIHQRVSEFTALLAPLGLVSTPGPVQSGWLRLVHREIDAFEQSTLATAESAAPDIGMHLGAIADAAKRTAHLSSIVLEMLDFAVLDIFGTIKRWDSERAVLRKTIGRLDVMLDGWPSLMHMTHESLREPAGKVTASLRALQTMLPNPPDVKPSDGGHASGGKAAATSVSDILAAKLSAIRAMLSPSRAADRRQLAETASALRA
jgi:hypothetical protein